MCIVLKLMAEQIKLTNYTIPLPFYYSSQEKNNIFQHSLKGASSKNANRPSNRWIRAFPIMQVALILKIYLH